VANRALSVVLAVTDSITARYLLRGQLGHFASRGYDVTLVCSPGEGVDAVGAREGVRVAAVPMAREVAPIGDFVALWRMWRLLRRLRPDAVNASTPKAGLLGMLAARLAAVPVRVYTLRGLRLETAAGGMRRLLWWLERLAMRNAHRVVCVSESLRQRVVELHLAPPSKLRVLGAGSSNGVDAVRIGKAAGAQQVVAGLRQELGLAPAAPVIGFVGRLTRDKGVEELVAAFYEVRNRLPETRLLVLGDFEEGDPVAELAARSLGGDRTIVLAGWVRDTAPYYGLMNVLAFPSHREGFPNAPLEAAAAGVPTVGFAATGTVDAVVDGVTGRVVPVGDVGGFAEALFCYLTDDELRRRHGDAARRRVVDEFAPERVWAELERELRGLMAERGVVAENGEDLGAAAGPGVTRSPRESG
jgi:glycosyltransferase involved in cell wall biosynthesis